MNDFLNTASILKASGVAAIPTGKDKVPRVVWKKYMSELPSDDDLNRWFSADKNSMALVAGRVQAVDFDEKYSKGIFKRFCDRAAEVGLDHLIGELILQKTPTGGFHFVFQCDGAKLGNVKLASKVNNETMIETRGDGGYFLIWPSPGYELIAGDWSCIPSISEDDRDALLSLAKTFDERVPVEVHSEPVKPMGELSSEATPGDDFDFRADVPAILKQHGWKAAGGSGKYWTRPGKNKGISATWDVVPGRFYVFTSSTEFEPMHTYRPWHVYAMLECGGDYSKAASELRRQGFGGVSQKPAKSTQPLPADWNPPVEALPDDPPAVDGIDPSGDAPTIESPDDKVRRLLAARAFDPAKVPPPIRPIFTLGGVVICTPGNITAVNAQAKVGKSALMSALTAASFAREDADCLSATGFNESGKAFLYFDTEQSRDDFWHAINRAKKRAEVAEIPEWLHAYAIGDLPATTGRKSLAVAMADFHSMHGGIHAVIIDGVADLVLDVNDAEECNNLVSELFQLATRYDCSIICVIHKNPGSEKTRGHLGSQIERKSETNLTLEKDDQVTVIWSNKQRRAPIDKKTGPRFKWDDELQMHISVTEVGNDRVSAKAGELKDLAIECFNGVKTMRYLELVTAITKARDVSEPTAKNRIKDMRKSLVIFSNSIGHLTLENPVSITV